MDSAVFFGWISAEPPILYCACDTRTEISHLLPDEPIYQVRKYAWWISADGVIDFHRRATAERPQDVIFHLVNEESVADELVARGIPAYFISANCFLDETLFTVKPHLTKEFDAVYNARMSPFKRHHLAKLVQTPLFIGGIATQHDELDYFAKVRGEILHGAFTHASEPNKFIPPSQIVDLLNRSRVGLCLSAKEGQMYAAVEYLLCGLPVVSTTSLGGRDEWFDPRYVRIVPDDERAVADAVRELIECEISPQFVRQKTILRMIEHRKRFVGLLQIIFNAEGRCIDASRYWYSRVRHKLGRWHGQPTAELLAKELESCRE